MAQVLIQPPKPPGKKITHVYKRGQFAPKDDDNPLDDPTFPQIARGMAKVADRVWQGMPTVWSGSRPSKQAVGALGEKVVMHLLAQKTGDPFEPVDTSRNNAPIDVWGDGMAVEAKTGLGTVNIRYQATSPQSRSNICSAI